jgi:hypothetical protein
MVLAKMTEIVREDLREPDAALNELSRVVLDAALEVHRALGAGFMECIYEGALAEKLRDGVRRIVLTR